MTRFTRQSRRRLSADSYRRAAKRIRHYADLIEREAVTPAEKTVRTRAINQLSAYAGVFRRRHAETTE